MKLSIFWFRRDLRLEDNTGLFHALSGEVSVLPIFIFDENILNELPKNDARVNFIHERLHDLNRAIERRGGSILCLKGQPVEVWRKLLEQYDIDTVYTNKDYEPYALKRDKKVKRLLAKKGIVFKAFKDQVIFEENEVLKNDGKPYTVYTPYKNKWLSLFSKARCLPKLTANFNNFHASKYAFPTLADIGFEKSNIKVKDFELGRLNEYAKVRDFPYEYATSYLSPHLRFGTIGIRNIISKLTKEDDVFLSELIWREFFMQILFHFPMVVSENFKPKYNGIKWRNNKTEFARWCEGTTGYPMVDAGMRQLNETGYMHNRVRMITAGFLCKHLLIDWRWGEGYFAEKLLDYELASNNGNWQWAAGTGCDAAPYFRIFNPSEQLKKFDKKLAYVKRWIPELETLSYPTPIVEHKLARARALEAYKIGLGK